MDCPERAPHRALAPGLHLKAFLHSISEYSF